MTIRLQILTKSARTHLKSADHEARAAFFASHRCWRETQEKGTDSKLTCQGEKGGQTQNLTMASPRYCVFLVRKAAMEGSWFFFTPLGNVIFHTALAVFKWWQTGHNKCDTRKAWLRSFFFFLLKNMSATIWVHDRSCSRETNLALRLHYSTAPLKLPRSSNVVATGKNPNTMVKRQHFQKWFCKSATLTCLCRKSPWLPINVIRYKTNRRTSPERYPSSIHSTGILNRKKCLKPFKKEKKRRSELIG